MGKFEQRVIKAYKQRQGNNSVVLVKNLKASISNAIQSLRAVDDEQTHLNAYLETNKAYQDALKVFSGTIAENAGMLVNGSVFKSVKNDVISNLKLAVSECANKSHLKAVKYLITALRHVNFFLNAVVTTQRLRAKNPF